MKNSNHVEETHPQGGTSIQFTLDCFGCGRESVHTYAFGYCPYCDEELCGLSLVAMFNEATGKADPKAVKRILKEKIREA